MELIFGAGKIDRRVADVEGLLRDWREKERDFGQLYLEHEPITSPDRVFVEDLAVTMLINSRVEARQATGVVRNRATLDLSTLPGKALGETTDGERQVVAELIGAMTSWPGIGASVATKTLHNGYRQGGAADQGGTRLDRGGRHASGERGGLVAARGDRADTLADRVVRHGLVDALFATASRCRGGTGRRNRQCTSVDRRCTATSARAVARCVVDWPYPGPSRARR